MNKLIAASLFIVTLFVTSSAQSESGNVFEATVNKPMELVYRNVIISLEKSRFYLFYEMDIGKNLGLFAESWGDQYNQNDLTAVRSIVFCNGWLLNRAGNIDPKILGLCPMHVTLIEKHGVTTALFVRPTATYKNSAALSILVEIESEVIEMIRNGMK